MAAPTTLDETGCSEVSTTVGNADKDDTNPFGRPICLPIELHDILLRQNLAFKYLLKENCAKTAYFVISFRKGRWHRRQRWK